MRGFAVGSNTLFVQRINAFGVPKWQEWQQKVGPRAEVALKLLNEKVAAAQRAGLEVRMTLEHPGHARVEVHEETGISKVWLYEPGRPDYTVVWGRFTGDQIRSLMEL
jgi:hypothetical protein